MNQNTYQRGNDLTTASFRGLSNIRPLKNPPIGGLFYVDRHLLSQSNSR